MYTSFQSHLQNELQAIEQAGLYKNERIIVSPQGAVIRVADGQEVLNFCANNYLGLSNSPELKQAAKDAIDSHGYGVSSVRFICGTQDVHKQLESAIAQFFGTEDTILYAACFDANGGVFEPLLTEQWYLNVQPLADKAMAAVRKPSRRRESMVMRSLVRR